MDAKEKLVKLSEDRGEFIKTLGIQVAEENWHGVINCAIGLVQIDTLIEDLAEQTEAQVPAPKAVSFCTDCNCGKAEGCGS